jgi:hypothetical protein
MVHDYLLTKNDFRAMPDDAISPKDWNVSPGTPGGT